MRPVISNDLRVEIGDFRCQELLASCALIQNNISKVDLAKLANHSGNVNIAAVQNSINESLDQDLRSTLGGPFFTGVHFNLAKITLSDRLQASIEAAQAAFADITKAQARVASARADAAANRQREAGYRQCPACATIDTLKAIPPNVTTFAPGAGFSITPGN
jgi:hypothetical protein